MEIFLIPLTMLATEKRLKVEGGKEKDNLRKIREEMEGIFRP
jgi:hypothetical protein